MKQYYAPAYTLKKGYTTFEGEMDKEHVKHKYRWLRLGKDAFASPVDAIAVAEAQRLERVASLRKSLTKLEALTYGASK